MSYASLLGLPDPHQESAWWFTRAEADQEVVHGQLKQAAWEWGDHATFEPFGTTGLAIRYASGSMTVEILGPIFQDATGAAAVCGGSCTCCCEREPALRAGIWPVAQIVEHLL